MKFILLAFVLTSSYASANTGSSCNTILDTKALASYLEPFLGAPALEIGPQNVTAEERDKKIDDMVRNSESTDAYQKAQVELHAMNHSVRSPSSIALVYPPKQISLVGSEGQQINAILVVTAVPKGASLDEATIYVVLNEYDMFRNTEATRLGPLMKKISEISHRYARSFSRAGTAFFISKIESAENLANAVKELSEVLN
jgi:hypothetical protein